MLALVLGALGTAVNIGVARVRAGRQLDVDRQREAWIGAVVVYGATYGVFVASAGALSPESGTTMAVLWLAVVLFSLIGVGLWVLAGGGVVFVSALDRVVHDRELSERSVRLRYGAGVVGIGVLAPVVWQFLM